MSALVPTALMLIVVIKGPYIFIYEAKIAGIGSISPLIIVGKNRFQSLPLSVR
jgi:hypothetical protein